MNEFETCLQVKYSTALSSSLFYIVSVALEGGDGVVRACSLFTLSLFQRGFGDKRWTLDIGKEE